MTKHEMEVILSKMIKELRSQNHTSALWLTNGLSELRKKREIKDQTKKISSQKTLASLSHP